MEARASSQVKIVVVMQRAHWGHTVAQQQQIVTCRPSRHSGYMLSSQTPVRSVSLQRSGLCELQRRRTYQAQLCIKHPPAIGGKSFGMKNPLFRRHRAPYVQTGLALLRQICPQSRTTVLICSMCRQLTNLLQYDFFFSHQVPKRLAMRSGTEGRGRSTDVGRPLCTAARNATMVLIGSTPMSH